MNKITATIVVAVVGLTSPVQLTFADSDSLPPRSTLTAEWRQWSYSIPTDRSPLLDMTGQYCMVGQRGSVWFLAGFFLGSAVPITRTCSVPEGTTLFFPVINSDSINAPNVCGQGPEDLTVKSLRASTKSIIDSATNLKVEVDGHNANNLLKRIQSPVYEIALPEDNVFLTPCGGPGTVPSGVYSPAVDDGYYATIEPLKPGDHTIYFHAETTADQTNENITYHLTVVPVSLKQI
jgi:hypothetical protein